MLNSEKKVKIIGVPIDMGAAPLGVKMGPSAIRHAGLREALKHNNIEFLDHGDIMINEGECRVEPLAEIARVTEELAKLVGDAIDNKYIPIILGGDHSVAIGSIGGASKKSKRLGVLWLDYHPDANTPETSPSGNIHGMPVAISLGYGYPQLVNCANFSPKVRPENFCIIGAKDIDKSEKDFLNRLGVRMFTLYDIERLGIARVFEEACKIISDGTDHIHVSFDIDVLDPMIAPGTGIISRGGLSYREIMYVMETLGNLQMVSSLDIIEINPLLDVKNQTAELAVELTLAALGGSFGDYERLYLKKMA